MSSPTLPTHGLTLKRDFKLYQRRMELFEMRFSNKSKCENEGDFVWVNLGVGEHPLAHLFQPVESPASSSSASFRGRIFIAGSKKLELIYNSDTSIYTDWPPKKMNGDTDLPSTNEKLQNSADDDSKEILLPMAGGIDLFDDFQIIIHPHTGNDNVEAIYESLAVSRYHNHELRPLPTDNVGWCTFSCYLAPHPPQPRTFDKPFEFTIDTAYRPLTLEGIVFSDSKEVNVEVTWNRFDGVETYMYVAGWITVVSEKVQDKESVLFDNPPKKVVKALTGQKLPLLRSVVAVPYISEFQVEVKLVCFYSRDENSPIHNIVDDFVLFPNLDRDIDARDTSLMPNRPHSYESKKFISGNGGNLEVKVNVDYD